MKLIIKYVYLDKIKTWYHITTPMFFALTVALFENSFEEEENLYIDGEEPKIDCKICKSVVAMGKKYLGGKPGTTPKTLENFLRGSCKMLPTMTR